MPIVFSMTFNKTIYGHNILINRLHPWASVQKQLIRATHLYYSLIIDKTFNDY